ncbi:MAG: peptide ABC transporter substrate-binding protein [Pseudomonadales bacterium]|nr:peptide ABC transporter substrate-binding protein [Pseudomonadales bacterium]
MKPLKTISLKQKLRSLLLLVSLFAVADLALAQETLRVALPGEPETLDPHRYNLRLEETLLNELFLGLTTFDAHGGIVPGAAQSWTTSEDGLVWTFNLQRNLSWSDGKPLNAHDFVYAYRRLQDPNTAASLAYFMYMLKNAAAINTGKMPLDSLGANAIDDYTLALTLEKPYPFLLERLLYPTAYPVPRHVIEQHGKLWTKPQNWVSNGAYTLSDWIPRAHIDMSENEHFAQPGAIKNLRYIPVTSEQTAYNRFRSGELDVIGAFPIGELENLREQRPDELRISNLLSMMYLVFNTQRPPFDDVRVRQALSLAVDQTIITDKVLKTGSLPAHSFAPALIADYDAFELPHKDAPFSERQNKARQLLKQAGFADGLEITLRHINGLENKKVNLAIGGMWKAIGVNVKLQQADIRGHFADLRQGSFDVAWAGWVGENNAEHYLSLLQSDIGNVNYGRFDNKTFDDVMAQVQLTKDVRPRNELLRTAEEIATHFYPVVPLYTTAVRSLVNNNIDGWFNNGRDMHQARYLSWRKITQTRRKIWA